MAAIIMGIAAGTVCYACVAFKNARKWDDALDVWGVHGMGGLTGAILTGTLASPHIWDTGDGWGAWTGHSWLRTTSNQYYWYLSLDTLLVSIRNPQIMDVWPGGISPLKKEIGLDLQHRKLRKRIGILFSFSFYSVKFDSV